MPQTPKSPKGPCNIDFTELMQTPRKRKLSDIRSRQVYRSFAVSASSDISDFLEAKVQNLADEIDYIQHFTPGLHELKETGKITAIQLTKELKETNRREREEKEEFIAIKRQRKLLEEDMAQPGLFELLELAYAHTIKNRVISATGKMSHRRFKQSSFRKSLEEFYDASHVTDTGERQTWCMLTGWHPPKDVKAAHIVPQSLSSEELAYLYGAGGDIPHDDRNGE